MEFRPEQRGSPIPDQIVELRVHGVGGATPEELLDVPHTTQVAGDPAAGFFRPWSPGGRTPALEGYSWGGLTSASRLRALWVLLMPFALVNLAGWMIRHAGDESGRPRTRLEAATVALFRLFGLVLTVAVVAYVTVATVDLIAYQCAYGTTCAAGRWWLSPFDNRLVDGRLGRLLVVGGLVPLGLSLLLGWLARRSQLVIHPGLADDGFAGTDDPALTVGMTERVLWTSPHVAHRLALVHTSAAVATVGVTIATVGRMSGVLDSWLPSIVGSIVLGLAGILVLRLEGVPPGLHGGLLGVAAAQALTTVGVLWWSRSVAADLPQTAPGVLRIPGLLVPVYLMASLVIGLAVWALWRGERRGRLRVAMVAPTLLLAAAGIVNAFGAGMLIRVADLLGSPVIAAEAVDAVTTQPKIVYPDIIGDTAVVTVFAMIVTVVVAAVVVWRRLRTGPGCSELADRYSRRGGLDCGDPADAAWAAAVSRAEAVAALTDRAGIVLGLVTAVVVIVTGLWVVVVSDDSGFGLGSVAEPLAGPASAVLGLLPLGAVYAISSLYRSRAVRRTVGILWDVATFWPRWFHPWSPPAYGERAVIQLEDRLSVLTETGTVVVSAHSQGSVLAVATLALADEETASATSLLTHGSPLTRLYAHYFPDYFNPALFGTVKAQIAGWINLWRATDYIGGKIDAAPVEEVMVFDPPSSQAPARGEPRPRPARHSDFDRTEEYDAAIERLTMQVGPD